MNKTTELDGHYQAEDLVSVWVGNFPDRHFFEDYLKETWPEEDEENDLVDCPFWKDLGISWNDHDFQEANFEEHAVSIAELLAGLSFGGSYTGAVLDACRKQGIESANAIVLIFEYDYPVGANFQSAYLTYLGSFPYSTGGHLFRRG